MRKQHIDKPDRIVVHAFDYGICWKVGHDCIIRWSNVPPCGLCDMGGGALRRWDRDFDSAARFVMSPPIRGAGTAAALKGALAGGLLGAVGTDHAVRSTPHHLPRSGAAAKLQTLAHGARHGGPRGLRTLPPMQTMHGHE